MHISCIADVSKVLTLQLCTLITGIHFHNCVVQLRESNDSEGEPMDQESVAAHKDIIAPPTMTSSSLSMKRTSSDGSTEPKRQRSQTQVADPKWVLDKQHADAVVNFLIR